MIALDTPVAVVARAHGSNFVQAPITDATLMALQDLALHANPPRMGEGKALTLIVPVNALAGVSAQSMSNFGLGVAQYINQLETDGTRVCIIGAICSKVSGKRLTHTWTIKLADQPLDLAILSFAIGHPAMFRRLGFALRERSAV